MFDNLISVWADEISAIVPRSFFFLEEFLEETHEIAQDLRLNVYSALVGKCVAPTTFEVFKVGVWVGGGSGSGIQRLY